MMYVITPDMAGARTVTAIIYWQHFPSSILQIYQIGAEGEFGIA